MQHTQSEDHAAKRNRLTQSEACCRRIRQEIKVLTRTPSTGRLEENLYRSETGGIKNYFVEMNRDFMKASVPYLRNLQV
jgi:plasmid stabilization system protein ParE